MSISIRNLILAVAFISFSMVAWPAKASTIVEGIVRDSLFQPMEIATVQFISLHRFSLCQIRNYGCRWKI
jgi:hypothetical protein